MSASRGQDDAMLARLLRPRLRSIRRAIIEAVPRELPEYARSGAQFQADLRSAVALTFATLDPRRTPARVGAQPLLDDAGRRAFTEFGAAEARAGRGIETVLAAYRVALRVALDEVHAAVTELRDDGTDVDVRAVLDLVGVAAAYLEEVSAASLRGHEAERGALRRARERGRLRLFETLMNPAGTRPGEAQALAAETGWPLSRPSRVLVTAAEDAREVSRALAEVPSADVLEGEVGGELIWIVPVHSVRRVEAQLSGAPAWWGTPESPTALGDSLALARRLRDLLGTASEHRSGGPAGSDRAPAPRAEDHLLTLVVTGDPIATDALLDRRLGELDALAPSTRDRLLDTLEAWLRHWGSRQRTAEELFVHPQTVGYRVGQARELLGVDLDDATVRTELLVALTARSHRLGAHRHRR